MANRSGDTALSVLQLDVRGMHCVNCADLVERKLKKLAHLQHASVNYPTGRAVVRHSGKLDVGDLQGAIGDEGYTLSIIVGPDSCSRMVRFSQMNQPEGPVA